MSWEKKTTRRKKMPDLRLGDVFQLPIQRISRRWTRSGTNLVIFLEAFCAQTNLFWCEMIKTICILKSNTRQENFHTLDILNAHFYTVREESGLPVGLFKDEFTPQSKMKCFKVISWFCTAHNKMAAVKTSM